MKYVLIIPDGVADEPQASLGNRTPLQAANIPHMDRIASLGIVGGADNTPPSLPSGSDVATMSLFGYNPLRFHTGRAPIEAAAQGIPLGPQDWAVRCNLVTVVNEVMRSFTAGQISNNRAQELIALMQQSCGDARWEFHAGVSYRNLLIYRGEGAAAPFDLQATSSTPPHDITDQPIGDHLPSGPGSEILRNLMTKSREILRDAPANRIAEEREILPATQVWLWGLGQAPALQNFHDRFGVRGAMITAVDLLRGLARLLGWNVIEVPGATGYLDTDYAAKGRYACQALETHDFVVVHVEATDEASHEGHVPEKVQAVEQIDRHIVGPIHEKLISLGEYRILVSPDHPTFLRTKTHSYGIVPFALAGTGIRADRATTYDEHQAARSDSQFPQGWELMQRFLHGSW